MKPRAGRGAIDTGSRASSELERILQLAERFAPLAADPSIVRGIGDDAAVLDPGARPTTRLVWTIDAQVEGVHFRLDLASWRDVGWRSFMAAASDLAAMGATPWCALSALVLPQAMDDDALNALTEGQAEAARVVGAPIVGGNLSRGGETSITTTLLGTAGARPLARTAKSGDGIWVSGSLGRAAAGLAALERRLDPTDADVARAVLAWRRPRARIAEGLALSALDGAHGAIDVSDGLAQDLGHIARASSLRAVLDETALLAHVAPDAALAHRLGASLLDLALHGGEDYALLAALAHPVDGFVRIGRFEAGEAGERIVLQDSTGATRAIDARGFDHFR